MFDISQVVRYARKWRADRRRAAVESALFNLPADLQKDIGWPALRDRSSTAFKQSDVHAGPLAR